MHGPIEWKGTWEVYWRSWRTWTNPSNDDAEGEWKIVGKKAKKGKTVDRQQTVVEPLLSSKTPCQFFRPKRPNRIGHFWKFCSTSRTRHVRSLICLTYSNQKTAHAAKFEALIQLAGSPKTAEIHKILTAELARVTKNGQDTAHKVKAGKENCIRCPKRTEAHGTGGRHLQSHGSFGSSKS